MAKRKRLTPANPAFLGSPETAPEAAPMTSPLPRPTPPIADMAGDAAATAALAEVTEELSRARAEGRMVLALPLAAIEAGYLVRDRIAVDQDEMQVLVDSLRARGQQTPVEVAELPGGRYGLISGWRRVQALRRLQAEAGEDRFDTVLALLRRPEHSADAYVAMVEENEIRVGLSYYERARIAARAVDQGVFETEKAALRALYQAASRAKRSKIRSFLAIVHALDGSLRFPETIGERMGLALAKALEADPGFGARLRGALDKAAPATAEAEQAVLAKQLRAAQKQSLTGATGSKTPPSPPVREIAPGLAMKAARDGSLTLSGQALTPELTEALAAWLRRYCTRS